MTNYFPAFINELSARLIPIKPHARLLIPYAPQFMSLEKIEQYLSGTLDVRTDPLWKTSGAKTKDEYELWTRNGCGMTCLQMILKHLKNKNIPFVALGKLCETYGGYRRNGNTYDGLFYEPFCTFIQQKFELIGTVAPVLTIRRIQYEISNGHNVIASVDPAIRDVSKPSKSNGGHLVVITGYNRKNKTISLHNPSGLFNKSQIYYTILEKDFRRFFAGRGIIVYKN